MPATTYPDAGDLQAFLTEIGFSQTVSTESKDSAIAEAVRWVETQTGRVFTSSHSSEIRKYDNLEVPGRYVVVEIEDAHSIGSVKTGDSATALTVVTDYVFLPRPLRSGQPYEAIKFIAPCPYGINAVTVTGQFGWAAVPEPIKSAVIAYAAATIISSFNSGSGGVATERKIGDRMVKYANGMDGVSQLTRDATSAISSYVRVPYV